MQISRFFLNGDIKGAIAYMREHQEFRDVLPAYTAIFENCEYRTYDVPDRLNDILRLYQVYYRDVFYCGLPEAEDKLLTALRRLLDMPDAEEALLAGRLQALFEAGGFHALFGKTQGYYGPYVWRETVPTVYRVELPGGTAEYTVNILKGFVFRSWMDYLTFGRYGTGGWASPDGAINCIAQAYGFESERFLVSLLKHEAQHTVDMRRFPGITPTELEYRAKLVELHYAKDPALLQKFLSQADESREGDSHAMASARIRREFADADQTQLSGIQTRALELFCAHTKDRLTERLTAAGFDPPVKSFFSWLGVTYYLSAEAIDKTFAELSLLCAEGSTLVFDYLDENFFAACEERVQNTVMMAKAGGEAMQAAFSCGELEKLLETHGFLIYQLLTPEEIQRDVIDRAGAALKAFEHVNYCLAVRK